MLPQSRRLSGPPEGDYGFDKGKGRQRATMACVNCRKRKIRCDSKQPVCSTCERLGKKCDYEPISEQENLVAREKKRLSRLRRNQMAAALGRASTSFNVSPPSSATQLSWPSSSMPFGMAGPSGAAHRGSHPHLSGAMAEDGMRGRKRTATLPSSSAPGPFLPTNEGGDHLSFDQLASMSSESSSGSLSTSPFHGSESSLVEGDYAPWLQQSSRPLAGVWQSHLNDPNVGSAVVEDDLAPLLTSTQSLDLPQHSWQSPPTNMNNSLHLRSMQEEMELRRRNSASDARLSYSLQSPVHAAALQAQTLGVSPHQDHNAALLYQQLGQGQPSPSHLHPALLPQSSTSLSPQANDHLHGAASASSLSNGLSTNWQGSPSAAMTQRDPRFNLHPSASSPDLSGLFQPQPGISTQAGASPLSDVGGLNPAGPARSASLQAPSNIYNQTGTSVEQSGLPVPAAHPVFSGAPMFPTNVTFSSPQQVNEAEFAQAGQRTPLTHGAAKMTSLWNQGQSTPTRGGGAGGGFAANLHEGTGHAVSSGDGPSQVLVPELLSLNEGDLPLARQGQGGLAQGARDAVSLELNFDTPTLLGRGESEMTPRAGGDDSNGHIAQGGHGDLMGFN